jgi:hypothetical protein
MACGGHRGAPLARFASLAALVALGKHLGMFVERTQNSNVHYAISDTPMTKDEWVRRYVTPH